MKTNIKRLLKEGKMGGHLGKPSPNEEVLNIYQASWLLQLKPEAVRNAVRHGLIPGLKIGNRLRFSKRAVLGALDVKRAGKQ